MMETAHLGSAEAKAILKRCREEYPDSAFVIIKIDRNPTDKSTNKAQIQTNLSDDKLKRVLKSCETMIGTNQN